MKGRLSFRTALIIGALMILLMSVASCHKKREWSGGSTAAVTVLANPSSITANGTTTITATVVDSNGNAAPDGTIVSFSTSTPSYGSLSNSTVTTANGNGVATTTFTAGSASGIVKITATSNGVSNFTSLTVGTVPGGAVATGSIQFVSATPQIIGIKGAGKEEISVIAFLVSDLNGNPINGASVSFTMTGPNGGEFIGEIDSTPDTATALSVNGNVSVVLHSGSIAGTITIVATTLISGVPISTSATPISIGGGVASASHFTLARSPINLEGLGWANLQSKVIALLGDRFGNYNVMNGTSVSFYAEAGAIDAQGITGAAAGATVSGIDATPGDTGEANVVFRTQDPIPQDVLPAVAGDAISMRYFYDDNGPFNEPHYYNSFDGLNHNPRDGWATIIAATKGEETFLDENLDGLFTRSHKNDKCPYSNDIICECDGGTPGGYSGFVYQGENCSDPGKPGGSRSEGFIDMPGEPFIDLNDDGLWDNGQTYGHPLEQYIDTNHNGAFDGLPNRKWDGPDCQTSGCEQSKTIWKRTRMVISGAPEFLPNPDANNCYNLTTDIASTCSATFNYGKYNEARGQFAVAPTAPPTAGIPKGGSGSFTVIVGDINLNRLQGGTTIKVTVSALASGPSLTTAVTSVATVTPSEYTVADGLSIGPTFFDFTVSIPDTTADTTTVTVEVTTPNGTKNETSIKVDLI